MSLQEEEDIIATQHRNQWNGLTQPPVMGTGGCAGFGGFGFNPELTFNPEPSRTEQFDKTIKTITQERGKVYGHPREDFSVAADLMRHFDHLEDHALRHALRMVCVKLARLTTTPDHLDSYVDIVGYVRTAVMVLDKPSSKEKTHG